MHHVRIRRLERDITGQRIVQSDTRLQPSVARVLDKERVQAWGIEACQKIRALDNQVAILAVTANIMTEDVKVYMEVGFDACVGKPIDVDDLAGRVSEVLGIVPDLFH